MSLNSLDNLILVAAARSSELGWEATAGQSRTPNCPIMSFTGGGQLAGRQRESVTTVHMARRRQGSSALLAEA